MDGESGYEIVRNLAENSLKNFLPYLIILDLRVQVKVQLHCGQRIRPPKLPMMVSETCIIKVMITTTINVLIED